uniref:Solute carrier organic anion transporter family member n=1 Tax=Dracunculus medinensis TaxID=318479 RepID=A0A0N4U147_DRAME
LEAIGGFYMTSSVVSIEKQFQITSRMSGLMVSAGDFGYIPSVIFVSYLGGKGNRAKWIGGGCLLIAFANFLISMSNFLFPVGNANTVNATEISSIRILTGSPFSMCSVSLNALRIKIKSIKCSTDPSNSGPFVMIFVGLLILGIGRTMPFSLGLPLVDDNVRGRNLPVYLAGMFFIRILGPVLGLMIGSVTNKYYYSFSAPPGISPRDPMWIGRWWAGFLGIAIIMFGPSLALYFFPVPKKVQKKFSLALIDRNIVKDQEGNAIIPQTIAEKFHDFASTIKAVLKAPVYLGMLFGRILDVLAFKGFFLFLPKYLEVQFGMPQHKINFYMGIIGVTGFATGVVTGSLVMRKFKLRGRKAAAYVTICSAVAACLSFINAAVGCKSVLSNIGDLSNLIQLHILSSETFHSSKFKNNIFGEFNNACNERCNCDSAPLYPVCNSRGESFYSPCHAGCALNFSVVSDSFERVSNFKYVARDFCSQDDCESKIVLYLINMAVSGIFGGMGLIPSILMILRFNAFILPILKLEERNINILSLFISATLPSPVIWGWIIDKSCILWNNVCGDPVRGACAIYDSDQLRIQLHMIYGLMRTVGLFADLWVLYFAKNLILISEEKTGFKI